MVTWKDIKPKSKPDALSMIYCSLMVHSAYIYGEVILVPWLKEEYQIGTAKMCLYQFLAFYFYLNVIGNIYKIVTTNTSTAGKMLPTLLRPGWRYCYGCEANSPPRSFHCIICKKCILKRDHHCMFTSQCVGHFNFRYYFWLLFYGMCGTVLCMSMSLPYVYQLLGGFSSWWNILYFFLPLFCCMFQIIPFWTAVTTFLTLMSTIFTFAFLGLFIWHCSHVYRGTTTYESHRQLREFDLGPKENIVQFFGRRWYLTWICPWIDSPLPSDGFEFKTNIQILDSKNQ